MKLLAVVVCVVAALALATPAGFAAAKRVETKVICINGKTFEREYREQRPRRCIFHRRHSPMAEAFFVRTKHDRWKVWHRRHARGKGRAIPSMGPSARVRIRLSHPVHKCGHRVFSRAHFFFPKFDSGSSVKLDTCA
jgi:hypothetical protein